MSIMSSLLRNSETDTDIISTYWLGIRENWKNIRVKRFHARNVGISLSHSIYMIKMRHVFSIGLMILFRFGWLGGSVNQTDHVKPFFHIFLTCVRGWTSTINPNTTWQTYESMVLPFQTFTCVCVCAFIVSFAFWWVYMTILCVSNWNVVKIRAVLIVSSALSIFHVSMVLAVLLSVQINLVAYTPIFLWRKSMFTFKNFKLKKTFNCCSNIHVFAEISASKHFYTRCYSNNNQ